MRFLLAATAAAALLASRPAVSCDSDHKASHAATHADCAAKCPHAAAKARQKELAAAPQAVPAVLTQGGEAIVLPAGGGCPHARGAQGAKTATAKHEAAKHQTMPGGHAACPHAARAAQAAQPAMLRADRADDANGTVKAVDRAEGGSAGREMRATGKVVCARCELKRGEACRSVFQQADSQDLYPLCDEAVTEQLLKLTRHGELEVTVHGRVRHGDGGDEILCVDGFSVGTI